MLARGTEAGFHWLGKKDICWVGLEGKIFFLSFTVADIARVRDTSIMTILDEVKNTKWMKKNV